MEDLLRQILDELRSANANLDQIVSVLPAIAPVHDLDDIYSRIEEVGDQITGGIGGSGGKDLSDVVHRIEMLEISIG